MVSVTVIGLIRVENKGILTNFTAPYKHIEAKIIYLLNKVDARIHSPNGTLLYPSGTESRISSNSRPAAWKSILITSPRDRLSTYVSLKEAIL